MLFLSSGIYWNRNAFYKDAHQKIFRAIHKLFLNDDPVDLLTVSEALKQSGELEQVGGYYYLSQLTTRVASAAHIEFHAKIIVQKYLQRKLIGGLYRIAGDGL